MFPFRHATRLGWLTGLATYDFCPWANRYVYWLKEPVGWFALALILSLLVGAFLSPLGWSVAAGLFAVLVLGLGFPWLATRTIQCELRPINPEVREGEETHLELMVRNRLPLPVIGLMIEDYCSIPLPADVDDDYESMPDCGLARVPALSTATYRLPIRPAYRGEYPVQKPKMACSFPFGIWTARIRIRQVHRLLVRPMLVPIVAEVEWSGSKIAETGHGQRATCHGDFLGVREFRRGDSLRSIHWVQSARNDSLIVCERGGPQHQPLDLYLSSTPSHGSSVARRENLAWRVRIVAGLVDLCVGRHIPIRLWIDGQLRSTEIGGESAGRAWRQLALVPLDGGSELSDRRPVELRQSCYGIHVSACTAVGVPLAEQLVRWETRWPNSTQRRCTDRQAVLIDLDQDVAAQLNHLLAEVGRANSAA